MQVEIQTEWTVGNLIEFQREGILRVNAEYQRGLRWTELQKCMFVDSILRGYSIPAFYFHKVEKSSGRIRNTFYDIVDGQQRVNAIFSYSEDGFELIDPSNDVGFRFPTFMRSDDCPWAGQRFSSLLDGLDKKLLETPIVVYELTTTEENEVRDLFIRLQGGTPLTPQDKRDSWPGKFTEFVLKTAGKSGVDRWYGHRLFKELVKGNESRRRHLLAQIYMQFSSVRHKRFCDMKSANIDVFYHENVGFDSNSQDCKRFIKICETMYQAFSGKPKLQGHHLVHCFLLVDSLLDGYTRGWESKLSEGLSQFEERCRKASEAAKKGLKCEFDRYWRSYAQWTRTSADVGRTVQRRHVFFCKEMLDILSPKKRDEQRLFSDFEKQIVFFRDEERCQFCKMVGEEHPVTWNDSEIHHVTPHSEGGRTSLVNGALVHVDCHPRDRRSIAEFREWWGARFDERDPPPATRAHILPPEGTLVKFEYRGRLHKGRVAKQHIILTDVPGRHSTFSQASYAVTNTSRNGWRDWEIQLPTGGVWLSADQWRTQGVQ